MAKQKKYALVNSYFKHRQHNMPDTVLEIANYKKEHGELPFEYSGDNWVYDAFIERQKRSGVFQQQYFTPDATAKEIASLAVQYKGDDNVVVDACCGSGQLTKALLDVGFDVEGFDFDESIVSLCEAVYDVEHATFTRMDFKDSHLGFKPMVIVSNPPYDLKDVEVFLSWLDYNLDDNGTAILLIPKGLLEKERPKALVENLKKFAVLHRTDVTEPFVHTKIKAEIVVMEKSNIHPVELPQPAAKVQDTKEHFSLNSNGVFLDPLKVFEIDTPRVYIKILVASHRSYWYFGTAVKITDPGSSFGTSHGVSIHNPHHKTKVAAVTFAIQNIAQSLGSDRRKKYSKELKRFEEFSKLHQAEAAPANEQVVIKDRNGNSMGSLNKEIVEAFQKAAASKNILSDLNTFPMADIKTEPVGQFANIPLAKIIPDANQPRKFFDQDAMDEFTKTIKHDGVLQAIVVRPIAGGMYMIVVGERRFRASLAVQREIDSRDTIPANIRVLNDFDALRFQISENLSRRDVHPLDEAKAFKDLLDHKQMSMEEIAVSFGKEPKYVAQRLKLNDLLPELQQVFFAGRMTGVQAQKLSRVPHDIQKAILEDKVPKDWKNHKDWNGQPFQLGEISYLIEHQTMNLDRANFKTTDAKLYPEAGACTKCPFNSANSPLLFDDMKGRICQKSSCFHIKQDRWEARIMEEIAADPERIVIAGNHYTDAQRAKVSKAKEMGINVLTGNMWKQAVEPIKPDEPLSFEAWKDKNVDEDEDDNEFDVDAEYQDYLAEEARDIADYEELKKEYDGAVQKGLIKKGFVLVGNSDEGKEIDIIISESVKDVVESASGNAGDVSIQEQINKWVVKEMRDKVLDQEKVWGKTAILSRESFSALVPSGDFTQDERNALALALVSKIDHPFEKKAFAILGLKTHYIDLGDAKKIKSVSMDDLFSLMRLFFLSVLDSRNLQDISHTSSKNAYMLMPVLKQSNYLGDLVAKIELEQKGVAMTREERVEKKIAAIKKKLSTATEDNG